MSLFLGRIHYWLFNKIIWFEGLEEELVKVAEKSGLDVKAIKKEINEKYGERLPNKPLEEMIDTSNIHGWLQDKINAAEGRTAALTAIIINSDTNGIGNIEKVYVEQGIKAAKEAKAAGKDINTAQDIFNSMNDYVLDGMPCDRVNEVICSSEEIIKWTRRMCVHKDIWNAENIDVKYFYDFRNLWIKAFVCELNSDFEYLDSEDGTKIIKKI